jgi:diacylglycerol kinase family enzyme
VLAQLLLYVITLQEAEMCDAADRDLKNALGPLAYVISGAQKLLTASNFKAIVTVDGETAEGEVAAITVANAAPPFSVLAHGHTGECIYDGERGNPTCNGHGSSSSLG